MDLVPGQSLTQLYQTKRLSVAEVKDIFRQLLKVVDYLQDCGVCHRDINPNNVMVDENNKVTLIDFNVAKRFIDPRTYNPLLMMSNAGSPKYMAPEMLVCKGTSYDEKVDMWSTGALLYYMLTAKHAFEGESAEEIEQAIISADYKK